jgi:hypothetical protein
MSEPQAETQEQGEEPTEEPTPLGEPTEEEEAAEEEEQETQEQDGSEPEGPSEASAAAGHVGEKELEKMFAKVERANVAYVKRIGESMGEEFGVLEQCPRCASPFLGFIFPPMMQPVTADVKDKVLASVGEQPAMATQKATFARRCDDCDGNGVVLSGSRRNDQKTIRCQGCEGRGFVYVGERPTQVESYTPAPPAPAEGNGVQQDAPDTDLWGRPAGHPDYGRHPMYVGA